MSEMNLENHEEMHTMRNLIPNKTVTIGERTHFIGKFLYMRREYFATINDNEPKVKAALQNLYTEIGKNGINPSRLELTTEFLLNIFIDLEDMASTAQKQGNRKLFVSMLDFSHGFGLVAAFPKSAEEYIAGRMDQTVAYAIGNAEEKIGQGKTKTPDTANLYIRMMTDLKNAAEILKKDPSGLGVTKDYLHRIRKKLPLPLGIGAGYIPSLMTAGAEFAFLMYRKIYPLTEGIV